MTSENLILHHISDGVCTITFNRPAKKNAFTMSMYEDIVAALDSARQDDAVRVILLCGAGGVFTAGNDLRDFLDNPPQGRDSPVFGMLLGLAACEKPVVAAVQGPAIGIGTTMLLHCDLVYADEGCRFQLPFVNLGLTPEGGSTFLLPRLAGDRLARELLLLGEPFSAETAVRAGIVNDVLPGDEVMARARAVAQKLAEKPAACLAQTRALISEGVRQRVAETLLREGDVFIERLASAEAREAFKAFFERREPDFSGMGSK